MNSQHPQIIVVGAGPVGLTLALALGKAGIRTLVFEKKETTSAYPRMDITNGRSMELLRHLGVADQLRAHSVGADLPLSVVYRRTVSDSILHRFDYPCIDEVRLAIANTNDGSQACEPAMRITQPVFERELHKIICADCPSVEIRFAHELVSFSQDGEKVSARVRDLEHDRFISTHAEYLVGCDGANSTVRSACGIDLEETSLASAVGLSDDPMRLLLRTARNLGKSNAGRLGDRVLMVHFRCEDQRISQMRDAWHTTFPDGTTIISQNGEDAFTAHFLMPNSELHSSLYAEQKLGELLGDSIEFEILLANVWKPRFAVAEVYRKGRVLLAGDSAHQMPPPGGYGMNTGIGDACDLGWKLAAVLKGWGDEGLLASYEIERQPVAKRNVESTAKHLATRFSLLQAAPANDASERLWLKYAATIRETGNLENESFGVEFDYRYSTSP